MRIRDVTRDSYWYANGTHSNGKREKIRDLADGHIINIVLMYRDTGRDIEEDEVYEVMLHEVKLRGIDNLLEKGEYIPYMSERSGELITDGSF